MMGTVEFFSRLKGPTLGLFIIVCMFSIVIVCSLAYFYYLKVRHEKNPNKRRLKSHADAMELGRAGLSPYSVAKRGSIAQPSPLRVSVLGNVPPSPAPPIEFLPSPPKADNSKIEDSSPPPPSSSSPSTSSPNGSDQLKTPTVNAEPASSSIE